MPWLDRWAPRVVPRGRMLGALLMVVVLLVGAIVVAQPARKWVRERGERKNALVVSQVAEAQLAAGDIAAARVTIDGALRANPTDGNVVAVSQKVMVAEIAAAAAQRDADQLKLEAQAQLAIAEEQLRLGDAERAFEAYSKAVAYDPAAKDPALIKRIAAALQS